jgi:phosphoribosylanthranilate isomerase
MKIKVCGMRNSENIQDLLVLKPDFVGFIFYEKSKRFVANFPKVNFPNYIKKVGVFVNEEISEVLNKVHNFQLNYIQLHGNETIEYCKELRSCHLERSRKISSECHQIEIIKAFSVNDNFDFSKTQPFEKYCDYFLFDTKGKNYGGNGVKFNWEILQKYKGKTPFLLSGGIIKEDVDEIKKIKHSAFEGIDINSGFEIEPGLKNINNIKEFKYNLG